jgi:hypothetical protein
MGSDVIAVLAGRGEHAGRQVGQDDPAAGKLGPVPLKAGQPQMAGTSLSR